ncbi:leucyl aminopeptidase [Nitratidesulfovibrio vulgaris]|uniref:Probable cytosol aminopeptidase n=1 Tax=Nitratidesulfovibrio vulgaris (strain ATCC 29579 / DSM 644 / CCUG 34227 / NCIMB 8303 / VKM B-1760 / Hildenborough) TaxID=882 RepID=AMPA_NITV2|nr:leucyl aminopeptidase [Nitratidesulfovibrio vulgaris]Q72F03.1 RecName: Full=Probable cytosol aminopeptidase; AltName: Full=Leucine aminopeptidase; Short=LAP; AltName: Full=Leucyl aminopeptidase [Nitratidesulfovibrio vulgaris str. Hildenborough]AAS94898.1 cytosol aminopeptidase [Nitratidesulfovibrio vulgaris str. Hildenborough]ADP85548.1 Leucyl aminopeptidase [Nitratidesulfovibrio vulgaris RCH1]
MDIRFQAGGHAAWRAGAVMVFVFKDEPLAEVDSQLVEAAPWLTIAPAGNDFRAAKDEVAVLHGPPAFDIPRVVAVGLGKREDCTLERIRLAAAAGIRRCRDLRVENVGVVAAQLGRMAPTEHDALRVAEEVVCGALLGLYRYDRFRTVKDDERAEDPRWLALLCEGKNVPDDLHGAARKGEAVALGMGVARDLVNGPANIVTPAFLASEAEALGRKHGFRVEVLGRDELSSMGMGAFASVFRGAEEEARLIVIEHAPAGTEEQQPLVFVGKGVTFDTGGISLKPAAKMHEMKGDMAGAAAILGLFAALGERDLPRRVVGVLPCTENMPDGRATRPGDVVTTLSGKTVEILNTDAEGRLLLCDALTYAQRRWQPEALVDLATLTGACVVALGTEVAGLFCDDAALADAIASRGETVGDLFWPLPLWKSYAENLKSDVADLANVGPREGGAVNAALFLRQFIDDGVRWAHLDIAGPAFTAKKSALCPGGGTGFAVRTLFELVSEGIPAA